MWRRTAFTGRPGRWLSQLLGDGRASQRSRPVRILSYLLRRLVFVVPVLLGVTLLTFVTTRLIPGNPIDRIVDAITGEQARQELIKQYGFDQPVHVQFVRYLRDIASGKFGRSFNTGQDVFDDLRQRVFATLELTFLSMLLAIVIGIPFGVLAALRRNSIIDHLLRVVSVGGVSVPSFWLGIILIYIFFSELRWVPAPIGRISVSLAPPIHITGLYTIDALLTGNWTVFRSAVGSLVLPAVTLGLGALAPIARHTRSAMIEVLRSDYVRMARALGLPTPVIVRHHALKNALLPVITMIGVVFGYQLGGVVLVETVFSWPGLGFYAFQAATGKDYYAIQGFVLYATLVYMLIFLALDALYVLLDPRIEYLGGAPRGKAA